MGGALVNLTKSASTPSQTRVERRAARWSLHDAVATLLPGHRSGRCGHQAVPGKSPSLRVDPKGGGYYAGVRACGSVWLCPYCAAKVGRARAVELRSGVDAARAMGLHVSLVTFTLGHKRSDYLSTLLDNLAEGLRKWRSGRAWSAFAGSVGYVGSVRNLEVTWGEQAGWHPHSHALLFTTERLDEDAVAWMQSRWVASVVALGGYALESVALTVSDDDNVVAGYLSKADREVLGAELGASDAARGWGAAEELVYSHTKKGRAGGRLSPWGLLRALVDVGWADYGDRFVEYAAAFHGRRQLYWSRGLRAMLGLGVEASDAELADAEGESDEIVTVFTLVEWRALVGEGKRGALLDVLDTGGVAAAREWLWEWRGLAAHAAEFMPDVWYGENVSENRECLGA